MLAIGLLKQLGNFLLQAVGLGQCGDAGLGQDLVLGQVGAGLGVVGGLDCILRRGDVFFLGGGDRGDGVQGIDLGAEVASLRSHVADGGVDLGQRVLGIAGAGQIGGGQIGGRFVDAVLVADGFGGQRRWWYPSGYR
jgi:hypothetical protein